ncbi:hypothetical protein DFP72DRAFT_908115 [Ephemerocybe angulata]|uniref:F-box domain-containing protein n=1 Tax=Ephemerocybe angulata TaxID=980116 RepID=A0A8H6HSY8_9AGAR|nr:hypothetical protein DFP72DRAFT_908115 [Tulosesus angulatus]
MTDSLPMKFLSNIPKDIAWSIFVDLVNDTRIRRSWRWQCALISKEVKAWVEPALYRCVGLYSSHKVTKFCETIANHPSKPANFFTNHVKTLAVGVQPSAQEMILLLKGCTGVEALLLQFCLPPATANERIEALWAGLSPKDLCIPIAAIAKANRSFIHPILRNATRIELLYDPILVWDWTSFRDLESVTHVSVSVQLLHRDAEPPIRRMDWLERLAKDIVPLLPVSLKVFIVSLFDLSTIAGDRPSFLQAISEIDIRLVIGINYSPWNKWHWFIKNAVPHTLVDNQDFWEQAEAIVRRRQQGALKWPPKPGHPHEAAILQDLPGYPHDWE